MSVIFCSHCPLDNFELQTQLALLNSNMARNLRNQSEEPTEQQVNDLTCFTVLRAWIEKNTSSKSHHVVECVHSAKLHQCLLKVGASSFFFVRPINAADATISNTLFTFTKCVVHPDQAIDKEIEDFHERCLQQSERHNINTHFVHEVMQTKDAVSILLEKLNMRLNLNYRSQCSDCSDDEDDADFDDMTEEEVHAAIQQRVPFAPHIQYKTDASLFLAVALAAEQESSDNIHNLMHLRWRELCDLHRHARCTGVVRRSISYRLSLIHI